MPPLHFPYEQTSVWIQHVKIYRNFNSCIIDQCSDKQIRRYYRRKYTWSDIDFESVCWDVISQAMHMCSPSTRTWISKFSCGFLGTGQMMARREKWLDMSCPCCSHTPETSSHVITCEFPANRQRVLLILEDSYTWMKKMGVGLDFIQNFRTCTDAWLTKTEPPNRQHLPYAFQAQFDFGWRHLMFGCIHQSMCEHVQEIYIMNGIRRESQRFCMLLVHRLWTKILRPMWNARNKKVHALDSETAQTRVHLDTKIEAEELYKTTNVDMLPHTARKLFDDDLDEIISRPYHALRAWCDTVEIEVMRQASQQDLLDDTTQQLLHPYQPPQELPLNRPKRLPSANTDPLLSPIQLHIKRRRFRGQNHIIVDHDTPSHNPQPNLDHQHDLSDVPPPQQDIPPQRRPRRRRRLRLRLTPRTPLTRDTSQPPSPRQFLDETDDDHNEEPSPLLESARLRMLRGSWRPA